jgi:nitroimidazol reductase NimA-like FMN-containing flavoprotein (pyridoxamine 5'-phosphate oxidase superfamily)
LRRKEKEIIDKNKIESIIRKSTVCRLGLADNGTPYLVPLCFGYDNGALFFHSARKGRKCFEFDIASKVKAGKTACAWGMKYRSVIGFGKALFVEDPEERRKALDIIMRQYADGDFEYSEESFEKALVIKVEIESMTGKKSH